MKIFKQHNGSKYLGQVTDAELSEDIKIGSLSQDSPAPPMNSDTVLSVISWVFNSLTTEVNSLNIPDLPPVFTGYVPVSIAAASGNSLYINAYLNSSLATASRGGSAVALKRSTSALDNGVVCDTPYNRVELYDANGAKLNDGNGNEIYGRMRFETPDAFYLDFIKLVNGSETLHWFSSTLAMSAEIPYRFLLSELSADAFVGLLARRVHNDVQLQMIKTFRELTDVFLPPSGYAGLGGATIRVKSSEDGLEAVSNGVTGTGTATHIPFWSSAHTLSSDASLVWDSSNRVLSLGTTSSTFAARFHASWNAGDNKTTAYFGASVSGNGQVAITAETHSGSATIQATNIAGSAAIKGVTNSMNSHAIQGSSATGSGGKFQGAVEGVRTESTNGKALVAKSVSGTAIEVESGAVKLQPFAGSGMQIVTVDDSGIIGTRAMDYIQEESSQAFTIGVSGDQLSITSQDNRYIRQGRVVFVLFDIIVSVSANTSVSPTFHGLPYRRELSNSYAIFPARFTIYNYDDTEHKPLLLEMSGYDSFEFDVADTTGSAFAFTGDSNGTNYRITGEFFYFTDGSVSSDYYMDDNSVDVYSDDNSADIYNFNI